MTKASKSDPVPEGWQDLKPVHETVECFLPMKTPLSQKALETIREEDQRTAAVNQFRVDELVELFDKHNVGLVIDLSATKKCRYNVAMLEKRCSVRHMRLNNSPIKVTRITNENLQDGTLDGYIGQFMDKVDEFLNRKDKDKKIAVHCTHGVNRTGLLVCAYLIQRWRYSAERAIEAFEKARGVKMDRYKDLILRGNLKDGVPFAHDQQEQVQHQEQEQEQEQEQRHIQQDNTENSLLRAMGQLSVIENTSVEVDEKSESE